MLTNRDYRGPTDRGPALRSSEAHTAPHTAPDRSSADPEAASAPYWSEADFKRISRERASGAESGTGSRRAELRGFDKDFERISRSPTMPRPLATEPPPVKRISRPRPTGRHRFRFHPALGPVMAAAAAIVIAVATGKSDVWSTTGWLKGQTHIVDTVRSTFWNKQVESATNDRQPQSSLTPDRDAQTAASAHHPDTTPQGAPDGYASGMETPARQDDRQRSEPAPSTDKMTVVASNEQASANGTRQDWDIRAVQQALSANGLYKGAVDGDVGPKTRSALRAFQRQEGLAPTGKIDVAVLRALERQSGHPVESKTHSAPTRVQ